MTERSEPLPDETKSYEGYVIDAENAAEMARLMIQDRLLTQVMGGPLPEHPDPNQFTQVIDLACGPGGWLLDLGTQYPYMHGIGVDISNLMIEYANNLASSQGLSNIEFRVMDITQPLLFPDNTFDLVNGRIFTGFLSTRQWSELMQECARITKPGGILRLTEAEWGFSNSSALDTFMKFDRLAFYRAGHSFSPHGLTFGTANVLRLLLQQAGFHNIQCKAHVVDFSAGAEAHEGNVQNYIVVCKLLQPFFVQMQIASQEELDLLQEQLEAEVQQPDFSAIDFYLTVWGYKSA